MYKNLIYVFLLKQSSTRTCIPTSAFNLINYQCNRYDRSSNGGGLLTYIKIGIYKESLYAIQHHFCDRGLEVTIDSIEIMSTVSSYTIVFDDTIDDDLYRVI